MDESAVSAKNGESGLRLSSLSAWAPQALVVLGAALAFACFAREFLRELPNFSPKVIAAIAGGTLLMFAGSAWDALQNQRALRDFARFWTISAFVALMAAALWVYQIESRAFYAFIAPLTVFGFIVNHHLPSPARQPFFSLLAVVTLAGIFGIAGAPAAAAIIVGGGILIGVCHLPIPMWTRVLVLLACTGVLAALRLGWLYQGWIAAAVPVLASIFMFRLAVYLYDIANGKGPKDFWGRVGYFFMFPNLVFPFFPVVDFATFGRTYYNDDGLKIYQRGASYVFRGIIHLLIYRIVTTHLVLLPEEIHDAPTFLQHIVTNFGLYFRISGLFHLIVGLLVLFGYNLPETHTRFYFSNSFTDFWRRINIYWKDFMQKMVFNPSYMRFKNAGLPHLTSLTLSMAVVFFLTWALHAYQWFWLTGTLLLTVPDILFWALLGFLLIGQTLIEARQKKPVTGGLLGPRAFLVVRTVSTFLSICLLWSFWTSHQASDWFALIARSGLAPAFTDSAQADAGDWAVTLASVAFVGFITAIAMGVTFGLPKPVAAPGRKRVGTSEKKPQSVYAPISASTGVLAVLLAVQIPAIHNQLAAQQTDFVTRLATSDLGRADAAMMDRGYYEGLTGRGGFNMELQEFLTQERGRDGAHQAQAGVRNRSDYLDIEFIPNATAVVANVDLSINRWGMYDRDYTLEKPPGVFRIALVGASRAMGWGVHYDERFETILEDRLNREAGDTGRRYEILNFSVFGHAATERLMLLEQKALPFHPDAVMYVAGPRDFTFDRHASLLRRGVTMPYPFLDTINREAGVTRDMSLAEIERRMEPHRQELEAQVYNRFGEVMRAHRLQGIWIGLPGTGENSADVARWTAEAQRAGFVTTSLEGVYDPRRYRRSRWDNEHPNAEGHRLIADLLYNRIMEMERTGQLDINRNGEYATSTETDATPLR